METKVCKECNLEKEISLFSQKTKTCQKCAAARSLIRYHKDLGKSKAMAKISREKHKEKRANELKIWRDNNPDKIKKQQNEYTKKRKATDPNFKKIQNLRTLNHKWVTGIRKGGNFQKTLGCTSDQLRQFIENKFYSKDSRNMSWENYGKEWEIYHIRPLCSFNLLDEDEFKIAAHFSNLQPLWKEDNLKKRKTDLELKKQEICQC